MKCAFIKKDKQSCNNFALHDEKYCYWHSQKISEAEKNKHRSNGGKNKIIKCEMDFPVYKLKSISDVMKLNSAMINGVMQNKLDLRIATGICYMLNVQIKGIELSVIEKRINKIENILIKQNTDHELSQ